MASFSRGRRRRVRHFDVPGHTDRNLWEPATIHEVIYYIHLNPVKRGLVTEPEDWYWSSAADWAGRADVPIRVDRTVPMMHAPPA